MGQIGETGVDEIGLVNLKFPSGAMAQMNYGIRVEAGQGCVLYGTKGRIEIDPFWCAKETKCYDSEGNLIEVFAEETENGFVYEVQEMCDLLQQGACESEILSLEKSLETAKLLDDILQQLQEERK